MAPSSPHLSKLKVALKLSISRLRMTQQRETAISKVARRHMAQLLEAGKEESARIRVENIIRQDILVELMEILELYCELLLARFSLMEAKECNPGLEEPIKSLIYAAPRCEIKELQTVRQLLVEKFGKDFALSAIETPDGQVSERVLKKLRVEPPEERLVTLYLKEIARTYNISYGATPPTTPPPCDHDEDDNPSTKMAQMEERIAIIDSNTEELSKASPPKNLRSPINVAPPSPSTDNLHPVIRLPDTANMATVAKPPIVTQTVLKYRLSDDDELARRFAALKRP